MSIIRHVSELDPEAFRAACAERGASNDAEIANLLGVSRSTISRVLRGLQQVGPSLHGQMIHVLGAKTTSGLFRAAKATDVA